METPMIADVGTIGVSLYTLAQNNASFAQALNAALRQSMSENNIYPKGDVPGIETSIADANWDANAFLRGKMERPPYTYEPIIYFVKRPTTCESNKLPTVVIAQDVNDCDDVAGWRGSDEVLVSENEAKTSTEPIIFVGPGLGTYKTDGYTGGVNEVILTKPNINEEGVFLNDEIGVSERADVGIDADLYQIKAGFRYESSKRSEIQGWLVTFAPFTPSIYVLNNWKTLMQRRFTRMTSTTQNYSQRMPMPLLLLWLHLTLVDLFFTGLLSMTGGQATNLYRTHVLQPLLRNQSMLR